MNSAPAVCAESDLRQRVIDLGPWHHKIQLTPNVSTAAWKEAPREKYQAFGPVVMIDDHDEFKSMIDALYPGGVQGKSLLEAACNCGAYSLWFKQMGGSRCFAFDAREHWINQAKFLRDHCLPDAEGMSFEVSDLYQLPSLQLQPCDIGLFKGIFYHLPDPVGGLKIVADLTTELLVFNSATRTRRRPGLVLAQENVRNVMSGIHGLNWFPTGPDVIEQILRWMGFVEFRTLFWHKRHSLAIGMQRGWLRFAKNLLRGGGRVGLLAARTRGFFDRFDKSGFRCRYDWF